MKVLFLTRYPLAGASSRYRVYQYIPQLEKLGVECVVECFMDGSMYDLSFTPGRTGRKILATVRAIARRLWTLRNFRDYDIIYMQRELFPFGPPIAERWLKARGAKLVFDYDDALFIKKPSRYNVVSTALRSSEKTYDIFALCDAVVAGNDYLRDVAADYTDRAVTIEVAEDTDRIPMHKLHDNVSGVVIGWLGSKTTVKYLNLIEDVLYRIAERYPFVRYEIVGGGEYDLPGLPVTHTTWTLDGELAALARFDIGIMPLPLEEWSKGKSGGKARTYMAAGVPPVCTRIGYNTELIRHAETGLLCKTESEWQAALSELVERPDRRQQIAEAARKDVEERFSLERQAGKIHKLLTEVAVHDPASGISPD